MIGRIALAALVAPMLCLFGCDVSSSIRADAVDVKMVAERRTWRASYVMRAAAGTTTEVATGREVHVPLGAQVHLALLSRTYISDFRVAGLELRDFAAPNLPAALSFRAERPGRYEVRGEELCGLPHTDRSRGWLVVEDAASYRKWVATRIRREL